MKLLLTQHDYLVFLRQIRVLNTQIVHINSFCQTWWKLPAFCRILGRYIWYLASAQLVAWAECTIPWHPWQVRPLLQQRLWNGYLRHNNDVLHQYNAARYKLKYYERETQKSAAILCWHSFSTHRALSFFIFSSHGMAPQKGASSTCFLSRFAQKSSKLYTRLVFALYSAWALQHINTTLPVRSMTHKTRPQYSSW